MGDKDGDTCSAIKSEAECIASSSGCARRSSASKPNVCYNKGATKRRLQQTDEFSGVGAQDKETPRWKMWTADTPPVPGQYLLQWRWDNDQTPQIWTTCADITVIEPTVKWWTIVLIALGVVTLMVALLKVRRRMRGRRSGSGSDVPMTGVPKA